MRYSKINLNSNERVIQLANILYVRVSTAEQETARQEELVVRYKIDRIFTDKLSGKNTDRPQFKAMMAYVREGDTLYVESISRLSRSIRDLLKTVDELNEKGVTFVSAKESIDTSTPQGRFMLNIFGALAELEREQMLQRQAEGIKITKANGVYKGRQPLKINRLKFESVCEEWRAGKITAVQAQRKLAVTASTFYRRVKEWNL